MRLSGKTKQELFANYSLVKAKSDTGSSESQIALFTHRISHLTGHLSTNKKDYSAQLGLQKLVGKRKKMLKYLQKEDITRYRDVLSVLNLRK